MQTMQISFFMSLLTLGGLALAQVPFPDQCPQVKIVQDFDLDAYMGIWYEYSKYPFLFEFGKKCMFARYENIGNDTVSVVNAATNKFTGVSSNVTGQAKVVAPGQLAVSFSRNPNDNPNKANYQVLGVDYGSFTVVYNCRNFAPIAHTKIVWILTRERKPSAETVAAAKKVLEDNNLSLTFLIDTVQDNCSEPSVVGGDDDDGTTDAQVASETTAAGDGATVTEPANVISKA